jgi:hypothetical protein
MSIEMYFDLLPSELRNELECYRDSWLRIMIEEIDTHPIPKLVAKFAIRIELANRDWLTIPSSHNCWRLPMMRSGARDLRSNGLASSFARLHRMRSCSRTTTDAIANKLERAASLIEKLGKKAEGKSV